MQQDHLSQVCKQNPDWLEGLNSLAWIRATSKDDSLRRPEESLGLARQAAKLCDEKVPEVMDTLAAAYAAAGQFDRAVQVADKAIRLAESSDKIALGNRIKKRLSLYEQRKPYYDIAP